jgi:hypothetical protein
VAPGGLTGADGAAPSWAVWRAQAPAAPFGVLAGLLGKLPADRWPDIKDWNTLAEQRDVRNARGLPLRFVEAAPGKVAALDFERRILDAGEVQTRAENWHDAFHACTWLLFPRAKARINALHMEAGAGLSPNKRSPLRDLLTLFDESGMVIACAESALAGLLARFQWHALFWEQRARVQGAMDFLIFGHALFEHCHALRDGVTAKGMVVAVEPGYFSLPLERRIEFLDAALAARFTNASQFAGPRDLQPLPVKGIPGWAAENSNPAYYLDERQFRPGRTRDMGNGLPAGAQPQPDK